MRNIRKNKAWVLLKNTTILYYIRCWTLTVFIADCNWTEKCNEITMIDTGQMVCNGTIFTVTLTVSTPSDVAKRTTRL